MGVHHWTRLLREKGWLPPQPQQHKSSPSCQCTVDLWRPSTTALLDAFGERIELVPAGATLHIDGLGLVFFLYDVAYARHVVDVVQPTNGHKACHGALRNLTAQQLTQLIPTWMPLEKLGHVVQEFIVALQSRGVRVRVYWDGPSLQYTFKEATKRARTEQQDFEWLALQQYCNFGIVPKTPLCQWLSHFPRSKLFVRQVEHTLLVLNVPMITCDGEADAFIARHAQGAQDYILGRDSDFCFFRGVQYIPLETLDASHESVSGVVIRRYELAQSLELDENRLIAMAVILGNDYIPDPSTMFCWDPEENPYPANPLQALQRVRDGLNLSIPEGKAALAVEFVWHLYELQDLSAFIEFNSRLQADEGNDSEKGKLDFSSVRPECPPDMPWELLQMQPGHDGSVKDAMVRCIEAHAALTPDLCGIDYFNLIPALKDQSSTRKVSAAKNLSDGARPTWNEVCAAHAIESIAARAFSQAQHSPFCRNISPAEAFDPLGFFDAISGHNASTSLDVSLADNVLGAFVPGELANTEANDIAKEAVRPHLPIDEHKSTILDSIRQSRITIIQGETGCGKSSRIPIMILEEAARSGQSERVRLYMSQPHRIAAKSLIERIRAVEPDFRDNVALRMGHGVAEYESAKTKAWFVTTGYLVRKLAHQPHYFDHISHLIIDEVHERGVDTDILCLLCKRLLATNPMIRLILMSATLAAALYQDYFDVSLPPIFVGARRFPVKELFIEDLPKLGKKEDGKLRDLIVECDRVACKTPPSASYMEKLHSVAARLAVLIGRPGFSVLIFVPGMNDILAIVELLDVAFVAGAVVKCYPIHSDIPFEDQMAVFDSCPPNEIKIIVATNAAESSITLPDVDHVICLGLCKQIVYNASSHRQMLVPSWISRSSATQRAGRTGRVRPGTVFRLYTRHVYESGMEQFEPGEIMRVPLDSVILMLKDMLKDENITNVLQECLEPPDLSTIERSYESLHSNQFISSPEEDSLITSLGFFVLALGIDLQLGYLVGLGIQYGVGPEAIQMAAVLSFPKSPWVISSPLVHSSNDFNAMTAKTFASKDKHDGGLISEPFAVMNLLAEYEKCGRSIGWCKQNGIHPPRMRRLEGSVNNLQRRIAEFFKVDAASISPKVPPKNMPLSKLTILRVIQVWTFHGSMIQYNPAPLLAGVSDKEASFALESNSSTISEKSLFSLFDGIGPYNVVIYTEIEQKGTLKISAASSEPGEFEERLLSLAIEQELELVWVVEGDIVAVYDLAGLASSENFSFIMGKLNDRHAVQKSVVLERNRSRRGRGERKCGIWKSVTSRSDHATPSDHHRLDAYTMGDEQCSAAKRKTFLFHLAQYCKTRNSLTTLECRFVANSLKKSGSASFSFAITVRGRVKAIADIDLRDLFADSSIAVSNRKLLEKQTLSFPFEVVSQSSSNGRNDGGSPLLPAVPLAARLLSVLASGRRRDHHIKIEKSSTTFNNAEEGDSEETKDIIILPDRLQTAIFRRWKRWESDTAVFVTENSVPASMVPCVSVNGPLYCTCANILEVRGGGLRVEGLTMLPAGRLFTLLALVTFGLFPSNSSDRDDGIEKCLAWALKESPFGAEDDTVKSDYRSRIIAAMNVNTQDSNLGETLRCFSERIQPLLLVFSGLDGVELMPWDGAITRSWNTM